MFTSPAAQMFVSATVPHCACLVAAKRAMSLFLGLLLLVVGTYPAFAADGGDALPAKKAGDARYWETDWNFEEIDLATLQRRLEWFGFEVPVSAKGTATLKMKVSVPLNQIGTSKAYRGSGIIRIIDLVIDQARYSAVDADVKLHDGTVTLNQLIVKQDSGELRGQATAQVVPKGDFDLTVDIQQFNIGPVADIFTRFGLGASQKVNGVVNGSITASASLAEIGDLERWKADGNLTIENFQIDDSISLNAKLNQLKMNRGMAQLDSIQVSSPTLPEFFLRGSAKANLGDRPSLTARGAANDVPCSDLLEYFIRDAESVVMGKMDFQGSIQVSSLFAPETGSLQPEFEVNAAIASPSIQVYGMDLGMIEHDLRADSTSLQLVPRSKNDSNQDVLIKRVSCDYTLSDTRFQIDNLDVTAFGGRVEGDASWNRNGSENHQVRIEWIELNPSIRINGPTGQILTCNIDGKIDWSVPGDHLGHPHFHRGTVESQVTELTIGGEAIGDLQIGILSNDSGLRGRLRGNLFDGEISADALTTTQPQMTWSSVPQSTQIKSFEFKGLSLQGLLSSANWDTKYTGRLEGSLDVPNVQEWGSSSANVTVSGLANHGKVIAERIETTLGLSDDSIVLESINARVARGILSGSGTWSLSDGEKFARLRLTRADSSRLMRVVGKDYDQMIGGLVSSTVTIHGVGSQGVGSIRVSGAFEIQDGTVVGVPMGDAHGPFAGSISLPAFNWHLNLPTIRARFAHGNVIGRMSLDSAASSRTGVHLKSAWSIRHVDFQSLLKTYAGTSTLGRGDITGRLSLRGRNIASVNDLRGDFQLQISGTDATAVPGLSAAGALLGASALVGVRFEGGEVEGSIAKGNVRVASMTLASDRVAVQAAGRVGLLDNRLDFNAVLMTGDFHGQNVLIGTLGKQVLLQAIPIVEINRIVSNRAVVVDCKGTVQVPVITLLSGETLRLNAQRFVTEEALGLIIADSWLTD